MGQEFIVVTKKKLIVAVPVKQIVSLQEGDEVAGVVLVNAPDQKPEELK